MIKMILGGIVMISEKERMLKAREILIKMANGINPVNGEQIEGESFLHDPRIIRCLYYVSDVLEKVATGKMTQNKPGKFIISPEEKAQVVLPAGKIGVNEFARAINNVIDPTRSKKLTGAVLNKQLKKMGILDEESYEDGKTRTILNKKSPEYGIESEKRNYNGNEYEMILFNDKGKQFLLENLEKIMSFE
jgi:hypothetical protein